MNIAPIPRDDFEDILLACHEHWRCSNCRAIVYVPTRPGRRLVGLQCGGTARTHQPIVVDVKDDATRVIEYEPPLWYG